MLNVNVQLFLFSSNIDIASYRGIINSNVQETDFVFTILNKTIYLTVAFTSFYLTGTKKISYKVMYSLGFSIRINLHDYIPLYAIQ